MVDVVIIIVNYKVAKLVCECLESLSLEVSRVPNCKVVVVDNDSQDGSVDVIGKFISEKAYGDWAYCVPSDKNGGFAYGNNFGVKFAEKNGWQPQYWWLLNPDTTVFPSALTDLLDFMNEKEAAGICGSSIKNADGSLWPICFRFPGILSELERGIRLGLITKLLSRWKVPREMGAENALVDWLPGASFLIRDAVFKDIGLMDDEYFLYYEETDFCLNANRKGWECWYVPSSQVLHVAGASTGVTGDNVSLDPLPQYLFDSRYRYFVKNYGFVYCCLADFAWVVSYSLYCLRNKIFSAKEPLVKNLLRDSMRNSALWRGASALLGRSK